MRSHKGLVLHVQEGNGSLFGWFSNPAAQVSAHFWCAKDGTIEQYLDTDTETAWAQSAGNPDYLSVETEGFAGEALTPNQITKVAALLNWCGWFYGIPAVGPVAHGTRGFTQHCNPDGTPDPAWGNHSCPGTVRLDQMPTILAVARQPEPIPPYLTGEEDIMDSTVLADGTVVSHFRTPANHYIEMTRKPGTTGTDPTKGGSVSLIDITASYPGFEAAG
jgi:hypothetical protein